MTETPGTIAKDLWQAIKHFPAYILGWTVGLIIAVLVDIHITTLAITGVLIGFAVDSALWGGISFLLLYILSRIVGNLANAIGNGLSNVARKIRLS